MGVTGLHQACYIWAHKERAWGGGGGGGGCRRARDLLSFNDDVIGLLQRQGDIWWPYQELCSVSLFDVYYKKPHIFEFIYYCSEMKMF